MEALQGLTQTFEALQAGGGTSAELDELKTLMGALNDELKVGRAACGESWCGVGGRDMGL